MRMQKFPHWSYKMIFMSVHMMGLANVIFSMHAYRHNFRP